MGSFGTISAGRRLLPGLLAAALVAAVLPALAPSAPARAATPSGCAPAATDLAAAAALAVSCRHRVEVVAARSETGQVFVEPDGTQTMEQSAVPVRVHRADGTWADIDTTLLPRADGSLAPRVGLAEVALSGGGTGPLATFGAAGSTLALGWPFGALPRPSVAGDTATYDSVLPGVDLSVQVSAEGFRPVLVVHDAAAAANPALTRLRYTVAGDASVGSTTDGRVRLADRAGRTVATVATASMWDSSLAAVPTGAAPVGRAASVALDPELASTARGPGAAARVRTMPVAAAARAISLTPVRSLLVGPGVTYPVFIDPYVAISPSYSKWAYADSGNDSWDTNHQAWVGRNPYDGQLFRSYFDFPTTQSGLTIKGKKILYAEFDIELDHSWSCSSSPTYNHLYRTSAITVSSGGRMSFTTRPLGSGAVWLDSAAASANEDNGCSDSPEPDTLVKFSGSSFTSDVQYAASHSWSSYTVGMCACNSAGDYESTQDRWKRYTIDSRVKFIVHYDTPPGTPTSLTAAAQACGSYIGTKTPSLQAKAADSDTNDTETLTFHYQQIKPTTGSVVSKSATGVPANNYGHVTTGTLAEDATYQFQVQTTDANGYSSAWSGWCQFTVNTSNPPAPSVTSTTYPCDQANLAGCTAHGGPGVAGSFTFSVSSTSVTKYKYGWTNPPTTTVSVSAGASYSVSLTPPHYGFNTLYVQDVDTAAKTSGVTAYDFLVGAPSAPLAYWKLDDLDGQSPYADRMGGTGLSVDPTDNDVTALPDAHYVGTAQVPAAATAFDQTTGAPNGLLTASEPGLDTSRSFSVSAWAKVDDLTSDYHAVVSKDGTQQSVFRLEYRLDKNAWCFVLRSQDVPGASLALACGPTPTVGRWTHLLGVYNDTEHTLTLYVNGGAYSVNLTTLSPFYTDWNGGWNATGRLVVGAALSSSVRVDRFRGEISDVRLWTRAVTADELTGTDDDGNGNGQVGLLDPRAVSAQVGGWDFADQSPDCGCAYDTQAQDHFSRPLSPSGGVIATADDHDGNAAWTFDGSTGYARTAGPVLRTDQSFTVSAWVRSAATCSGTADAVLAQDGATVSPFSLEYNCAQQRWRFWMAGTDSATYTAYAAAGPVTALDGDWHLVLGVYDAGAGQLRLYLDGARVGSATAPSSPFNGTGPLTVGRQQAGGAGTGFFAGDVDEVSLWQGVLPDYQIADLYSAS